ncbi:MAG: ABC transporter permease [Tannerella sp.]|jgi:putative ABC transport system permease protein|nr:ABC transporter permease [Tannerella sp.]
MTKFIFYIKQACTLLRQEKLFSAIYIVGSALSITMVMTLSIVYYIKIADIYPEANRNRTLIVRYITEKQNDGRGYSRSGISLQMIDACIKSLKNAEVVTVVMVAHPINNYVQPEGSRLELPVSVTAVDTEWWKVFNFKFLEGKPFTDEDFQSGVTTAVISRSLAKKLYGDEAATGKSFSLNSRSFRVCGVVKDVSFLTGTTYAQIWMPYTAVKNYKRSGFGKSNSLGNFAAYILAPSASEVEDVIQEYKETFKRYAGQYAEEVTLLTPSQPLRQWQSIFWRGYLEDENLNYYLWLTGAIFLVLLLVPAISLSGMADSRMERRLAEMGVRRAFGARTSSLMNQILLENFIFTLLGGILGLILSYIMVLTSYDWLMGFAGGAGGGMAQTHGWEETIAPSMFFNIPVFLIALLLCFLLNLFSALIPAWKASRHQIVESLNLK